MLFASAVIISFQVKSGSFNYDANAINVTFACASGRQITELFSVKSPFSLYNFVYDALNFSSDNKHTTYHCF